MFRNILQKIVPFFLFIQGAYVLYYLKQVIITFTPNFFVIGGALIILIGGLSIILSGIGILISKRWALILYWIFVVLLLIPLFQRIAIFTIIKPQISPSGLPMPYEPISTAKIWFDYFIKTVPYALHYIFVTYFTMKFWNSWKKHD
ncbi:MAG: hypothetical protein ABIE43_01445 [Patescibacteria group bacterium]